MSTNLETCCEDHPWLDLLDDEDAGGSRMVITYFGKA